MPLECIVKRLVVVADPYNEIISLHRQIVFSSSLQEMEGDKKVVNLIEDWDVLAEYAGEKLGFYQLLGNEGAIEIRVQTGRIGYKKEFKAGDDPELLRYS